jgi:hypothetical protein
MPDMSSRGVRSSAESEQLRESFRRVGEKRYALARPGFRLLLGRDWRAALLGYTFLKALDDHVDEERDRDAALAWTADRRARFRDAYAGRRAAPSADPEARRIDADGRAFARYDRSHGAPLSEWVEQELDIIQGDVANRGTAMEKLDDLEAWAVDAGRPILLAMAWFQAVPLAPAYVDLASRAYLVADSLIDLKQDLAYDVIKIPREVIARYEIAWRRSETGHGKTIPFPQPAIDRWLEDYAPTVVGYMDDTFRALRSLPSPRTRALHRMMLGQKRGRLRRFLARRGVQVEGA